MRFRHRLQYLILLLTFVNFAQAIQKRASLGKLKFELNEKFLVNTRPCKIHSIEVDRKFAKRKSTTRIPERARFDKQGWNSWLRFVLRGEQKMWVDTWHAEFEKRQIARLRKGKGYSACIIWDYDERLSCCVKRASYKPGKKRSEYRFGYCMLLVHIYAEKLKDEGVSLKDADEEKLEDRLNVVLAEMAKDRPRSAPRKAESLIPLYGTGVLGVEAYHRKRSLTKREKRIKAKHREMVKFLVIMKRIEYFLLTNKDSRVKTDQKQAYSNFMKSFERCYRLKKTAVFYHSAAQRWVTCGPIRFRKYISAYCADLAAVSPEAKELSRKPIVGWESGLYEATHEYPTRGHELKVSDREDDDDDDDDDEDDDDEDDDDEDDDDDDDDERQRSPKGHDRTKSSGKSPARYEEVDLFTSRSSSCRSADLSRSCYAICCESVYAMSYFCRTQGLRCIGW